MNITKLAALVLNFVFVTILEGFAFFLSDNVLRRMTLQIRINVTTLDRCTNKSHAN